MIPSGPSLSRRAVFPCAQERPVCRVRGYAASGSPKAEQGPGRAARVTAKPGASAHAAAPASLPPSPPLPPRPIRPEISASQNFPLGNRGLPCRDAPGPRWGRNAAKMHRSPLAGRPRRWGGGMRRTASLRHTKETAAISPRSARSPSPPRAAPPPPARRPPPTFQRGAAT